MSKQYTPPADLLLKQYIRLAQSFTDRAVPQDNVLSLITSDSRYERALLGIRLLAQHHLGHTVQSLIAWRQHVNDDIKKNYSQNNVVNLQGVCKRAAMEILFLEAAMQVLEAYVPDFWKDRQFQTFFNSMQHVSFRWLLNSEEYVPHPELTQIRQHVVLVSGRIVGALSRIKLLDVCTQFVKKLEERVQVRKDMGPRTDQALARTQALKLCSGMRNLELTVDTDEQLLQSTRFLQKVHPFNYTTTVKKSQLHHALCEMLTDILTPLVLRNKPHSCRGLDQGLLDDWYQQILKLKNDIGQWANKHNKHIVVGYPLVTVLVCLVDDKNYNSLVDSMADFLAKQMKNKEYRSLCFKCLNQLVTSSLVRNAGAASKPQVVAWLDKIVKPGLINARKGGIPMQEQQEFVADIADLNPDYCVGSVVPDLLQADSLEAQLIALRTLYLVATSVPRDSASALGLEGRISRSSRAVGVSFTGTINSRTRQMVQLPSDDVLDLIRSGQHPFELQGIAHLLRRVQQQIAQLLLQHHRTFGGSLSYNADLIPKDKQPQLAIFSAVIRLVPLLKPEEWSLVLPLDLLPSYTCHADNTVRTAAADALMGTVRGCPALRGTVLVNMAAFIGSIPDDAASAVRGCMLLLRNLMESWLGLLQEQRLICSGLCSSRSVLRQQNVRPTGEPMPSALCPGKGGTAEAAVASSFALDVHHMEGILFMLFCTSTESIRRDAYGLLALLRTLHQQLGVMIQQFGGRPGQRLLDSAVPAISTQATAAVGGGSFTSSTSAPEDKVASSSSNIQPLGSGGSGTGVDLIRHHKPTLSRDSIDFMATVGQLESPNVDTTSIMDILEEVGDDVAHRCFWDFGDWSDLWRETKHVPLGATLQGVLTADDEVGKLRWMRCLVELTRTACHMCPASMGVAYLEMLHKLNKCLTRDALGRVQIPTDPDVRRTEAWRALTLVVCVCPPSLREHVEKAVTRKGASLTARELIRALLAALAGGSGINQQVCLMALGHASPEHYPVLFEELSGLMDEYQRPGKQKKGTARPEEARKMVANVMRLVADTMPQGTMIQQTLLRSKYLDWLRDTITYLRSLPPFSEAFWEVCQVAYCLCAVCRCIAGPLGDQLSQTLAQLRESAVQRAASNRSTASNSSTVASSGQAVAGDTGGSQHQVAGTAGQPMTRKLLFEMFMFWCEEGHGKGSEYHGRLHAGINSALARVKEYDTDTRESLKQELTQSAELLDQASRLAMAAMLQGPAFDPDAKRAQGPVLNWIDRLLKAPPLGVSAGRIPCVPKDSVGRLALFNLLCSNLDMFSVCVDRCYDRDTRVATGSFQVVSEVYALNAVEVEPHVVLSLVLYKMVDSNAEVREDALHMLHVLSTREWHASGTDLAAAAAAAGLNGAADGRTGQQQQQEEAFALETDGGSGTVVVLGAMQDSYQQFQFQLASKLARDHPELSEALCEEMMTRQLELADKVSQHPVLMCLGPWMENLTISPHWKGTWCERLLKSMYYVTLRHGDELPSEIEILWSRLANNKRNIIPILDFLASLGTHMAYQELNAMLEYLSVGKRICLYLARVGPQQAIDHLVHEITLQLHEEETAALTAASEGQVLCSNLQGHAVPLQFTAVLTHQQTVPPARPQSQQQPTAADTPGLLRSSASSWWAYSSTSSLSSSTAATPSAPFPSSSGMAAVTAPSGSTGLLGSMLGLVGSAHGGVAASYPPASNTNQQGNSNPAMSPTDPVFTPRGMRLSSTIGSALGGIMGSTAPTPSAASAGMGELREGVAVVQGAGRRSMTDHSDSTRSSLSLTGQGSTAGVSGIPDQGASSPGGAVDVSGSTALRPVAVGAKAGVVGASTDVASANAGGMGGYFGTVQSPGGAAVSSNTLAGSLAQDEPAGWAGADEGRAGNLSQPDGEPASPGLRGLVTRPELALCLLTEVAYEHDEDFSSHLALLCHVSLLLADHEEQLVAAAAQQLLINCLYSISARHLEMMQEQGQQVECLQATHLIKYLQSMRGRRLWSYEDFALGQQQQLPSALALAGLVQHCLNALSFEGDLQSSWCSVAFEWALHARSRHLACRSQQVLRALRPGLTAEMCSTLILCLQHCLAAATSSTVAREVALELLLTMRSLLEALPARKLLLFPQIFWSSVSLLFTSYVHIYQQALVLLSSCLQQLPLHDSTTQNVLLAAAPAADPGDLKQLLSACKAATGDSWLNSVVSGHATPVADVTAGSHGDTVRSRYGATRVRSPALAGPGIPAIPAAVGGNGDAIPGTAAVSSSMQSFVGGSDPDGVRPMHWPIAQMLPWPDKSPDGPAANMIALQQALFKGLLFQDTQLPTVQLLTLLLKGLCQLPPSAATPVQGPLDVSISGDVKSQSKDQPGYHAAAAVRTSNRQGPRTAGLASRSSSKELSAGVDRLLVGTGASGSSCSGRFLGASLQPEQLLGHHVDQQQAADVSTGVHSRGVSMGGRSSDGPVTNPAIISRSAPELRGLIGSGPPAADTQPSADSSRQQPAPAERQSNNKAAAAAGLSTSWGAWQSLLQGSTLGASTQRHLPGSKAAFQSLLGHRHAQLLVTLASIVPFFCGQLGQLEPDSELLEALQDCMLTLSAACCTQGLTQLGSKLQQFTASLNINSGSNNISSSASSQQQHHQQQSQGHLNTLQSQLPLTKDSSSSTSSVAFKPQGNLGPSGELAISDNQSSQLQKQLSQSSNALVHLLQGLCLQISRALLPTYADWLLRFWMGVLLLPGAAALHIHVLLLLRCLFSTPNLQLGPAISLLLDGNFTSPVVQLCQGALCQDALDTLDAIIHFASCSEELQQYQQQHGSGVSGSLNLGFSSASLLGAGATAVGGPQTAGPPGVDLQALTACLLPQLDVVELLQLVQTSCAGPQKRYKHRLLPFVGNPGSDRRP